MTALDAALGDSSWQSGYKREIESVQSQQLRPRRLPGGVAGEILCAGRSTIILT